MSKFILFLAFICLAILILGSLFMPDSSAMWLAATNIGYDTFRLSLMVILFTLMLTDPPRHHIFRVFVGTAAILLTVWSLSATYNNSMKLLDSASILAASISMGIVVLEYNAAFHESDQIITSDKDHQTHHRRRFTVH